MDITRLVITTTPPAIVAIVAGDADFVPVIEDAQQAGWVVEVWYWSNAAGDLKAKANRFVDLDPEVDTVGFTER